MKDASLSRIQRKQYNQYIPIIIQDTELQSVLEYSILGA